MHLPWSLNAFLVFFPRLTLQKKKKDMTGRLVHHNYAHPLGRDLHKVNYHHLPNKK
jgi:hypothetical protein